MDQSNINFEIYEDANRFLGVASATLPTLSWLTQTIQGVGIAGNIEAAIVGHLDALTLTLAFRTVTEEAISLAAPRVHNITLMVAAQDENSVTGEVEVRTIKHVMTIMPKSYNAGNVAPASPGDASGEYAVRHWSTYIDNKKTLEIDQRTYTCVVDGVDYLAPVRRALGRA